MESGFLKAENEDSKDLELYGLTKDCDALLSGIDFSSFCFTQEKNPSYRTGDMSFSENRCQITLADGKIELSIIFKDYSGNSPDEIKMRNAAEKEAFLLTNKMEFKKSKNIEKLGDYAVINEGHLSNPNLKRLSLRKNNLGIYLETDIGFCSSSDKELEKMGRLILESIIK
ncbi:hypothetical protein [Maribacter spongiicola]|uniref:hypothetical protein n=1 Tax=Maribacter spongiicola TaxID=1206753 RepID=UPI003F94D973